MLEAVLSAVPIEAATVMRPDDGSTPAVFDSYRRLLGEDLPLRSGVADCSYPSSKICSACGQVNAALTLADRIWTCGCGAVHDRDENAGTNLARLPASWAEALSDGKTVSVRRVALKRVNHPGRVAA